MRYLDSRFKYVAFLLFAGGFLIIFLSLSMGCATNQIRVNCSCAPNASMNEDLEYQDGS